MTLSQLDEHLQFQELDGSFKSAECGKKDGMITFFTEKSKVVDMLNGPPKWKCLIVWVNRKQLKKVQEGARISNPPQQGEVDGADCKSAVLSCRVCGCTDLDCRQCIEASGRPCHWVEPDLCSRCKVDIDSVGETIPDDQIIPDEVRTARPWPQAFMDGYDGKEDS